MLLCLVAAGPASADPRGDARDAKKRADAVAAILEDATSAARLAATRLELSNAALPGAEQRVATARGVAAAAQVAANTAAREANAARAAYASTAARFQQAQRELDEARQRVADIAAASYMGGNFAAINVLVGASGPQDAIERLDLVDQVMQKQQAGVVDLTEARRRVRVQQDGAGLAKRAAETAERDATDKLTDARAAAAAAVQAQATVISLVNARRQALILAGSQRAAVLAQYRQAKAAEARTETALAAWERRRGVTGAFSAGTLLMPVEGWKSSDFGPRFDPYYQVWQFHAGTDFAAPGGTPIHAADDGRVIQAGWNGGYGNYTCISHGRLHGHGFSTCYGHQSRILVHVGEYVRRGEVIGRVGTTGASTGYHLHFETRLNGVPKNPLRYLPACLC